MEELTWLRDQWAIEDHKLENYPSVIQLYQIRQCLREGCRLRYPVVIGEAAPDRCPRCRGSTRIVLERLLQREPQPEPPAASVRLEALIDNVRSAWNVGSIFRSADGAGFARLHLCGITPTPETSNLGKTALGAEKSLPWTYSRDGLAHARSLLEQGMRLWALEQDPRAQPVQGCAFLPGDLPVVLVVGNEVCGIDPEILDLCERVWYIPMQGAKRSHNVAVAFGIAAYVLQAAAASEWHSEQRS
jgi:tRNA G18 (ribose-2'-O)-methylase SpoU